VVWMNVILKRGNVKRVLAANDGKNGCVAKLLIIHGWKCTSVLELMVDYGK
jgi:hypothetical protein